MQDDFHPGGQRKERQRQRHPGGGHWPPQPLRTHSKDKTLAPNASTVGKVGSGRFEMISFFRNWKARPQGAGRGVPPPLSPREGGKAALIGRKERTKQMEGAGREQGCGNNGEALSPPKGSSALAPASCVAARSTDNGAIVPRTQTQGPCRGDADRAAEPQPGQALQPGSLSLYFLFFQSPPRKEPWAPGPNTCLLGWLGSCRWDRASA